MSEILISYRLRYFVVVGWAGGGGGKTYFTFFLISCFYHSENMYWVTLNVKINFKQFLNPHNPLVHTP